MEKIELATLSDANALYELEMQSFLEYERYSLNQMKEMLENSNYIIYKLTERECIVSYIILLKIENEYEILKICTNKNFLHLGYATKLIDYIIKMLDNPRIFLEVRESNIIAQNFYKSCDFNVLALRKNYYGNENAIIMVYYMGDGCN